MNRAGRSVLMVLALLLAPRALPAQEAAAVAPGDTIRVGDVVPVAVRLLVQPGERVAWPDTLPLDGDLAENAARVRARVDTLPDGRLQLTGVYGVTPWRTGEVPLGELEVPVVDGQELVRTTTIPLPVLEVVSVLPEDTTGIEPRPAKGVLGASWSWWRILLLILLIAALVAAGIWWLRRSREDVEEAAAPPVPPKERVLARLQEARDSGLLERGEIKPFYSAVSAALREYLESINRAWSDDLTTTELTSRFRAHVGPAESTALGHVLRPMDQVKFARRRPDADTALSEWQAARDWVVGFQWPPQRELAEHGEAA